VSEVNDESVEDSLKRIATREVYADKGEGAAAEMGMR